VVRQINVHFGGMGGIPGACLVRERHVCAHLAGPEGHTWVHLVLNGRNDYYSVI
jgi:hypothetical protein